MDLLRLWDHISEIQHKHFKKKHRDIPIHDIVRENAAYGIENVTKMKQKFTSFRSEGNRKPKYP